MAFIAKTLASKRTLAVYDNTPKGDLFLTKSAKITLVVDAIFAAALITVSILAVNGNLGAMSSSITMLSGVAGTFGFLLPLIDLLVMEVAYYGANLRVENQKNRFIPRFEQELGAIREDLTTKEATITRLRNERNTLRTQLESVQ